MFFIPRTFATSHKKGIFRNVKRKESVKTEWREQYAEREGWSESPPKLVGFDFPRSPCRASRQKEYLTPPLRPLAVQGTGFVQQKGESTRYSIGGLTTPGMHKDSDPQVSQGSRRNARGGIIFNQIE